MDDIDDLINGIIEEKPREKKKPVAISAQEPVKKPKEVLARVEEDLVWAAVPARKHNPYCGYCKKKLKGGETGWRLQVEDRKNRLEFHWWCAKCMEGILPSTH